MDEIKFITTNDCSLCDAGLQKVNLLFNNLFHINEIDVSDYNSDYIFRVPVVIYKDKILDEGNLSLIKLAMSLIWKLIIR
tara:strand:+ start:82 stop:321 length:240 start_codon:yes stop_codon:yes gene_type:complete